MNYKHNHKKHEVCLVDKDFAVCKPKPTKAKEILLECGNGTGAKTFTSSDDIPFQLANVTVDIDSLKRSEVLIKFSSLVKAELSSNATIQLKYELFKSCDGKEAVCIGTWMYEKIAGDLLNDDSIEDSFDFIFCECQVFNGCCDYFVLVTPIIIEGDGAAATISNGRMAALIQSSCDDSKQKKDVKEHRYLDSKEIISACGKGSLVSQNIFQGIAVIRPPITVAQVTIDTTCLNKPNVFLEFSTIISIYNQIFNNIVLQFELFKACGNSDPISCGTWIFEETVDESQIIQLIQLQNPFSFIFCECQNTSECCIYFVTVTALQSSVLEEGLATWEVGNSQLNAYAQSSKSYDSKYNNYKDLQGKDDTFVDNTLHPKPKKAILKCGTGSGNRTFNPSLQEDSFQLAQTSIDTSSLCKPVVNIEFSSTVTFEREEQLDFSVAQLQYELFRACDDGPPISIGVWIVDRFPVINNVSTETFSFNYCDCITCPGCCQYFVSVTRTLIGSPNVEDATITVGNGAIAALAQEG